MNELIKKILMESDEKEAKHILLSFLFDSININDFKSIASLIRNKNIYSLKYTYLLSITNITYKYKEEIKGYSVFFNTVKKIAKSGMTEKNYNLTFQNFK